MATKFVYSAAAGLNDGSSWANAWTSLASSNGVAAGDIVKVEYRHSESLTASITWSNGTLVAPVRIISCDSANSDALRTGATINFGTTSNIGFVGTIYVYGVTQTQSAANLRNAPSATGGAQIFESCTFAPTGSTGLDFTSGGTKDLLRLVNCTVDVSGTSAAGAGLSIASFNGIFEWFGGTYTCRATQTSLFTGSTPAAMSLRVCGVNFSGTVTNLFTAGNVTQLFDVHIYGCVPPTYTNVFASAPTSLNARINLEGFVAGTLSTAALPPTSVIDLRGTVNASTSRYRTGGSSDGSQANPYSWEFAGNSSTGALVAPLVGPAITRWVDAGASQVLKIYIASGGTLNNDEFWIDVLSPSEAGSATSQAKFRTTRCDPLATPAALTTDGSSTWNGSGVGTKQYVTVTISPTIPGRIIIRPSLAKNVTAYVDPIIELAGDVAGKSRFFEGIQTFAPNAGGGSSGMLFIPNLDGL